MIRRWRRCSAKSRMRKLEQHWLVRFDIQDAYRSYKAKQPDLGRRFNRELRVLLRRLPNDALLYAIRFAGIRRANLPSFPYGVFYFVADQTVVVLGILHGARDTQ